jgi:aspartate racemase
MAEPSDKAGDRRPPDGHGGDRRPLIGVLGGLGPAATVDFYAKVVAATRAARDQDHVRLIIDGDPTVPDRSASVSGRGESSAPALVAKARRLAAAGADVLAMPCNSAHAYEAEIRQAVDLPFVSIVEETVRAARDRLADGADRGSAVGVLATSATAAARLYPKAFGVHGVTVVEPDAAGEAAFMSLLYRIKGGEEREQAVRDGMAELACGLVARGAGVIVAGCTEVPLVLDQGSLSAALTAAGLRDAAFIDSSAALADAVVALGSGARGGARTPGS